jgi:hypothetical protein
MSLDISVPEILSTKEDIELIKFPTETGAFTKQSTPRSTKPQDPENETLSTEDEDEDAG